MNEKKVHSNEYLLEYPTVHEAYLYEKLKERKARCCLCERRCVLAPDKQGFCRTRININGKLYTMVYGDLSGLESRPIEIKPLFHFYPGSSALTFSTWSCNFRCPWCQNYNISRRKPQPETASFTPPESVIKNALASGDRGLCVSFNEPTLLFEFACDVFRLAKEKGLYNTFVSNGYLTRRALQILIEAGLDAIKIDLKGTPEIYKKYCKVNEGEIVWRNAKRAKELGLHVEIVNLVVTGVNDDYKSLKWLIQKHLESLGDAAPLHFTRYYPAYKFSSAPTSIATLEKAYEMARREGVLYPYLGNVAGHRYENTYCPDCGELLIRRLGFRVAEYRLSSNKKCPKCSNPIPIRGEYVSSK